MQTKRNLVGRETGGARVSISGVGQLRGRTGVSHRRSPVPVIFPSKAAHIREDLAWRREKNPRELEATRRGTKRRSRGARRSTPSPRSGLSSRQDKGKILSLVPSKLGISLCPSFLPRLCPRSGRSSFPL